MVSSVSHVEILRGVAEREREVNVGNLCGVSFSFLAMRFRCIVFPSGGGMVMDPVSGRRILSCLVYSIDVSAVRHGTPMYSSKLRYVQGEDRCGVVPSTAWLSLARNIVHIAWYPPCCPLFYGATRPREKSRLGCGCGTLPSSCIFSLSSEVVFWRYFVCDRSNQKDRSR